MAAWTYSDWITYESGNATRLERLRLHIQEVSDALNGIQAYSTSSLFNVERRPIAGYLTELKAKEEDEARAVAKAAGRRPGWSRAKNRDDF